MEAVNIVTYEMLLPLFVAGFLYVGYEELFQTGSHYFRLLRIHVDREFSYQLLLCQALVMLD